jgi:hypothetical protein
MKKENTGALLLITLAFIAIIAMFLVHPINQNEHYHKFSDEHALGGIPNFLNVVSNLPFLLVGLLGLIQARNFKVNKLQYIVFFFGISLVSVGSAYYHFNPTSQSLVWDRLPMTLAFMALFSIIISEYINDKAGQVMLLPLLCIGIISIIVWLIGNDLRMYGLVQFYPILAIPIVLMFYKSSGKSSKAYWFLLIAYIIAKLFEHFDLQLYSVLKIISGHSLKHIAAASGIYLFLLLKRKEILTKQFGN